MRETGNGRRFGHRHQLFWLCLVLASWHGSSGIAQDAERSPNYSNMTAMREDATLHAIAFSDRQTGLAVGDRGAILRTADGGATWRAQPNFVDFRLHDLHWIDGRNVVAVGGASDRVTRISRGVVLLSDDAGLTWQRANDEELPRLRTVEFDPESNLLIATGDFSHVALSDRFESNDGGQTWQGDGQPKLHEPRHAVRSTRLRKWAETTGVPIAVRGFCQVDSDLWAVGDHGVILHSVDRGNEWATRRGQGRQTGILVVAASTRTLAWPLIGNESLEMRNRVAAIIDDGTLSAQAIDTARQVAVMLGGSGADVIAADSNMEQEAANWIAVHQPAVIVLDNELSDATRDAFTNAAIGAGVLRIVSYTIGARGDTTLHRGALLPRRGVLLSDLWEDAMHWIAPDLGPSGMIGLRRLYDSVGGSLRGDSVVAGLPDAPGRKLATTSEPAARRHLQVAQARLGQPKQIAKLIADSRSSPEFIQSLQTMLNQTAKDDQFRLAWTVLRNVARQETPTHVNVSELRSSVLSELAGRFEDASVGKLAALRLHAIEHSSEWKFLRRSIGNPPPESVTNAKAIPVSPFQDSTEVRQASALSPIVVPETTTYDLTSKPRGAAEVDLCWEFHPLVLVTREASRHRGDDNGLQSAGTSSANLNRLVETDRGPWSRLLRNGSPSIVVARRTETRPKLDGVLDEAYWQSALPQAGEAVALQVAYDDDYVYFAMRTKVDLLSTTAVDDHAPVRRDHELSKADRLRLRIDTDLDLLTAMQLEMTEQGLTRDSIDGHNRWHPTWYVAANRGRTHVDFEIAVLRRDLTELPIHAGQSWFLAIDRLAAGTQSSQDPMPDARQWLRIAFQ